MKTIFKLKCCVCQDEREILLDNPVKLFLCSACQLKDRTKHQLIVKIDGCPAIDGKLASPSRPQSSKIFRKKP